MIRNYSEQSLAEPQVTYENLGKDSSFMSATRE